MGESMNSYLFEENTNHFLLPLSYFKHISELKLGTKSLFEKWKHYIPALDKIGRYYLTDKIVQEEALFINSRVIANQTLFDKIKKIEENTVLLDGKIVVAFRGKKPKRDKEGFIDLEQFSEFKSQFVKSTYLSYPWDLINYNISEITEDLSRFAYLNKGSNACTIINDKNVFLSENITMLPGVVINAEKGPIIIEENVKIGANSYLEGPLFIGKDSEIRHLSKLWNSSIHQTCKAGGEISNSIMLEYSNKVHDGFLGHSILGSWANIGAGTNVSNLKNNYKSVVMMYFNDVINTDSQFLGLIFGDHSKAAINSTFNTGTIVGVNTNIFGTGVPNKMVQSFIWGGIENYDVYHLDASKKVANAVMKRRGIEFDETMDTLFDSVFKLVQRLEY
jgi:UDP-N-acetylglucosamine diphosphorylase/glucosamine-1-phosphate N-acetyltransferase